MNKYVRRLFVIPSILLAFASATVLSPILLLIGILIDMLLHNRGILTRSIAMGWLFLFAELLGIAFSMFSIAIGVVSPRTSQDLVYWFQPKWNNLLLLGFCKLFSLKLVIDPNSEIPDSKEFIAFFRHSSHIDSLIPYFIFAPYGYRLRFVLKEELLLSPSLDLAGHIIPNAFVKRKTSKPKAEIAKIGSLLEGLNEKDGIVIFPEGALFRRDRLDRLRNRSVRARGFRQSMPPRLGGPIRLLENNESADIVFCAHFGFEGYNKIVNILDGKLIGRTISIRCWRFSRADLPKHKEDLQNWLHTRWLELDRWLESQAHRMEEELPG